MPEGLEGVKIVYEAIYKVESGYLLLSIFSFMLTLAVLGCSIICIIKKDFNSLVVFLLIAPTLFVLGFILAGLDFKYGWSNMPIWVVTTASIIFVISYILYAEVLRENTYLSRTIEVQENQKVIDTGLYGIVRHPMYFATTILFLSFPVVLGSWISFAIFCFFPLVLVKRIKNEEIVLENGLEGYKEYKQKVKYRMIPFVW